MLKSAAANGLDICSTVMVKCGPVSMGEQHKIDPPLAGSRLKQPCCCWFQMYSLEWKHYNPGRILLYNHYKMKPQTNISIGLGRGMTPNRRQATVVISHVASFSFSIAPLCVHGRSMFVSLVTDRHYFLNILKHQCIAYHLAGDVCSLFLVD